jgi:propionyl-CoA synthetase
MGAHAEQLRRSLADPAAFWGEQAALIDWDTPPERILDPDDARTRWYSGGRLNLCHNALDRHVEGGRADQVALVYDSPVTGTVARYTYRELRDAVARLSGSSTSR